MSRYVPTADEKAALGVDIQTINAALASSESEDAE